MIDLLPLLLWLFSLCWSAAVCVICVVRGHLFAGGHPEVEPVSWTVIYAQVCSVVLCAVPFLALMLLQHDIDAVMLAWYDRYQIVGAIVAIIPVIAEWVLMFMQSKRAERTQIDRILHAKR
ncbi:MULTISPECIES: C4-dicarboxylate ABC transporter [Bifidobacterium]|uniref:C4-dicarboxylate ABC transporter n=1 Tax=Bifidobacterium TaxID=1678 RepID=UPI001BDC73B0|nr:MULTISPECIES: C4-dicarboxylate ABC transporter [Bifidobacterium]MBT1162734.1 C4-dicarboxylate ABC transporter [Bifidobacterium sp. SO1]MBW3078710.1 C4-dicarboxylate ABC transporter [Bifidobacterium simiiventris]